MNRMPFTIDIEPTNRCNAKCHFCPRDQTPHEGLMRPEVFAQSLSRAVEYRDLCLEKLGGDTVLSLCGLGEPLLNKHTIDYVRQSVDAGFEVTLSTNASLLTQEKGAALLDAGLHKMFINVGDEGQEYDDIYKLPFDRTRDNILRFNEMSQDRCKIHIVLVDHHRDEAHLQRMRDYWTQFGITRFLSYGIMNRGGALFVDHMQFETYAEITQARDMLEERFGTPMCGAPLAYLFIGYDGQYYLCCSDWKKETPMGSVFDESFESVTTTKLEHVTSRGLVCRTCNLDPLNGLTEELRAVSDGVSNQANVDALMDSIGKSTSAVHEIATGLGFEVPEPAAMSTAPRRQIPLRVE
jgi:MoaA/NifB/PqqE/SkfB family radical SAM enzyme